MVADRLFLCGLVLAIALPERDAGACSCMGPEPTLISPDRVDDAPLNAHVRLVMKKQGGPVVLRVHGGALVETTSRDIASPSVVDVELVPRAALAPHTQYELAIEAVTPYPHTEVVGTFRTGDARDTVAPLLDAPSGVQAFYNRTNFMVACLPVTPWAYVHGVRGTDPDRPHAQLVYGVWPADAAGKIDPKAPPTVVLTPDENGALLIGQASVCDPRHFPLPEHGVAQIGIAAIDEAGNTSALRRVQIDTRSAQQP